MLDKYLEKGDNLFLIIFVIFIVFSAITFFITILLTKFIEKERMEIHLLLLDIPSETLIWLSSRADNYLSNFKYALGMEGDGNMYEYVTDDEISDNENEIDRKLDAVINCSINIIIDYEPNSIKIFKNKPKVTLNLLIASVFAYCLYNLFFLLEYIFYLKYQDRAKTLTPSFNNFVRISAPSFNAINALRYC